MLSGSLPSDAIMFAVPRASARPTAHGLSGAQRVCLLHLLFFGVPTILSFAVHSEARIGFGLAARKTGSR
jgi:hypothetical protein